MSKHVFICGYSRSGSTMLYNMMRTTVTNFRFMEREMPTRKVIATTPEDCVTKRPLDIFDVDNIVASNSLKKEIFCIMLIRDIRALITSRHKSVPNDYFIGFDHQYFIQGETAMYVNPGILQIHAAIVHTSQRQDLNKVMLRYEDLLENTDAIQQELSRYTGFQYGASFRDFYKHETPAELERALNTRRPTDLTRINAWKDPKHRTRIQDQFTRCPQLFDLLKIYGYEDDDSWFDAYRDDDLARRSSTP